MEKLGNTSLSQPSEGWLSRARSVTPENAEITQDVIELAEAWKRGDIGLDSIRIQSTGYQRFVASVHASREVMPMIIALDEERKEAEGEHFTNHGTFTQRDLREARARITTYRKTRVIQIPESVYADGTAWYREIPDRLINFRTYTEDDGD
jgi:hypothetical protein